MALGGVMLGELAMGTGYPSHEYGYLIFLFCSCDRHSTLA